KPGNRAAAPSDLASVSGYLLEPVIFDYLKAQLATHDSAQGEFRIQDAMQAMVQDQHHIYACEIANGQFYDTGNPLEYLKTVFNFALQRPDIKDDLSGYLRQKLQS
ncbi:MAG TPA: sugar phosphate nucleotidyltransferase, partial [Candidatus Saccharimonadales bacterium]|nr:sugar phosphate nucleotidyltransferase [Candidatus Saccharimonadales bacterium]